MAVSIVPDLIDALVSGATTALPDVQVYDGYGVAGDPGDFLMIGVDDPDSPNPANAADATLEWGPIRPNPSSRDETGTLTCAALSWNGDGDQKAARDAAYAIVAATEDLIRADTTLGLAPSLLWVRLAGTDLSQDQNDGGAMALVTFRLAFRARI